MMHCLWLTLLVSSRRSRPLCGDLFCLRLTKDQGTQSQGITDENVHLSHAGSLLPIRRVSVTLMPARGQATRQRSVVAVVRGFVPE